MYAIKGSPHFSACPSEVARISPRQLTVLPSGRPLLGQVVDQIGTEHHPISPRRPGCRRPAFGSLAEEPGPAKPDGPPRKLAPPFPNVAQVQHRAALRSINPITPGALSSPPHPLSQQKPGCTTTHLTVVDIEKIVREPRYTSPRSSGRRRDCPCHGPMIEGESRGSGPRCILGNRSGARGLEKTAPSVAAGGVMAGGSLKNPSPRLPSEKIPVRLCPFDVQPPRYPARTHRSMNRHAGPTSAIFPAHRRRRPAAGGRSPPRNQQVFFFAGPICHQCRPLGLRWPHPRLHARPRALESRRRPTGLAKLHPAFFPRCRPERGLKGGCPGAGAPEK